MDELDFFNFENIGMAPNATEKQPTDNVIKTFFGEWTFDSPYEPVAINLQTNEIYTNPSISSFSSYSHRLSRHNSAKSFTSKRGGDEYSG